MTTCLSALVATAATCGLLVGAGSGYEAGRPDNGPGSSASRTAYSFVYALKHANFGRACSYVADSQKLQGNDACGQGMLGNAAMGMLLFGGYVWGDVRIMPGSERVISPTEVVYVIEGEVVGKALMHVVKGESGKWRIVSIEAAPA